METFTSLLSNLGLLSLSTVVIVLLAARTGLIFSSGRLAIWVGIVCGLASVLVISFPIHGPGGELFDTRAAPILIAGYFGGLVAGVIAATIGAIDRYLIGGPVVWGGVASLYVCLATALLCRRFYGGRPLNLMQLAAMGAAVSVLLVPTFFMRASFETGLIVLQTYWLVILIGNLLGTALMGMIVSQALAFLTRQQEHQAIIEASADGILTINSEQIITAVNPAAERMFGWQAADLIGRKIDTLVPTEIVKKHHHYVEGFVAQKDVMTRQMTDYKTIHGRRKDGSSFPVLVSLSKFRNAGKTMVVATVHDMTEIQAARSKLEQMTETLAERLNASVAANESKNMFMANMSHELRTPLNAIIGFASLIEHLGLKNMAASKANEYIKDIRHSGEGLLDMINDILDISKIESGRTEISIEKHRSGEVLDSVLLLAQATALARQVVLVPSGDMDVSIRCDLRTFKQALLNLMTNAIKFSPKGSTVRICIDASPDTVDFSVQDDGIGISDNVISRLGEPFVRGDTPESRAIEGTGLGLALSKKFVERQGGAIRLARRTEGGTIATLTIPAA
tara:strand:- start:28673 stop:30370 length:1698 start_codon:yes stop_codon:yes gene_type:complete